MLALLCFFLVFALHRVFIIDALGFGLLKNPFIRFMTLSLGFLSDFWISVLFALVFLFLQIRPLMITLGLVSLLLSFHIPYVGFFHVTLRHVHLRYLFDGGFLLSSRNEIFQWPCLFQVIWGVVLMGGMWGIRRRGCLALRLRNHVFIAVTALFLGIGANFLANRYLRKWDLSSKMVENVVVSYVLDVFSHYKNRTLPPLSPQEWVQLEELGGAYLLANGSDPGKGKSNETFQLNSLADALQGAFSTKILNEMPRYIFLVLMESGRAMESSLAYPNSPNFYPHLDSLVKEGGIFFKHAHSTGTVTRSGSESTLCNSLSSVQHNALQENPIANPLCAPEILGNPLLALGHNPQFYWLHGGHLTFDGQGQHWRRKGFQIPLDMDMLPSSLPRTAWGLTDRQFFQWVLSWLKNSHLSVHKNGLHFFSLMTVTNHTAWSLPPDMPDALTKKGSKPQFPHQHTTLYADFALGEFVNGLKKLGIWDHSLMITVGDHGMLEPSHMHTPPLGFGQSPQQDLASAQHLSHIVCAMTGGLVKKAFAQCNSTRDCSENSVVAEHTVSQADVLPTLAHILNIKNYPFFGLSLLKNSRIFPVVSDLGEGVFLPQDPKGYYSKKSFILGNSVSLEHELARLYYKGYLSLTQDGQFTKKILQEFGTGQGSLGH